MILAPFDIQKNFWKYQTILSKKSNMSQQPKTDFNLMLIWPHF